MTTVTATFRWSARETDLLRAEYPTRGAGPVCAATGRSNKAVRLKARELGLKPPPAWSPAEDDRLRKAYGQVPTRDLARELGRTPGCVKQRARKLGLSADRRYTAGELALVRELYPTHTAKAVAARLGWGPRGETAVFKLAERLGLRKWPSWPAEVLERVGALHAAGHPDRAIALLMPDAFRPAPLGALQVRHVRQRLGLARNPDVEGRRAGVRRQLERLGLRNLAELRSLAYRRYAASYGLPPDLLPREVQIVLVLAVAGGPLTRAQIHETLGTDAEVNNRTGGSYLGGLVRRRGLVCRLPRRAGRRNLTSLYLLTPKALDLLAASGRE